MCELSIWTTILPSCTHTHTRDHVGSKWMICVCLCMDVSTWRCVHVFAHKRPQAFRHKIKRFVTNSLICNVTYSTFFTCLLWNNLTEQNIFKRYRAFSLLFSLARDVYTMETLHIRNELNRRRGATEVGEGGKRVAKLKYVVFCNKSFQVFFLLIVLIFLIVLFSSSWKSASSLALTTLNNYKLGVYPAGKTRDWRVSWAKYVLKNVLAHFNQDNGLFFLKQM